MGTNFNSRRMSLAAARACSVLQDKGTDYDQEDNMRTAGTGIGTGPGPGIRTDFRRLSQFSKGGSYGCGYNPRYLSRGGTRHPHSYSLQQNMTAICFVCNLPILSHQVGLVWKGGNGFDELVREQEQEEILRARLGRRDSAAQITTDITPLTVRETSPPTSRRRRSSLAQLTDILREWGSGGGLRKQDKSLSRRETLADIILARSLPWSRRDSTISSSATATRTKRRESSADFNFGINRGKLPTRPSVDKPLRRGSVTAIKRIVTSPEPSEPIVSPAGDQPSSSEKVKKELQRRNSRPTVERTSPKPHRLRRQSTVLDEFGTKRRGSKAQGTMPKISELLDGGRTEGQEKKFRDGKRVSLTGRPVQVKVPFLSPDDGTSDETAWSRKARRDSLSPDSAAEDDPRFNRRSKRRQSRRQSTVITQGSVVNEERRGSKKSPDSSSTCSSREPSPVTPRPPNLRRQSTTEEILIARGFRRQSTTEEMIRCRNFRRQSTQSEELTKTRGRRDSCAQITDGTIATMTVETTCAFFDTSTQTEQSSLYDNNHYHEECLRCNSCGINLSGITQKRARRFKNQILCDLHFADVALMECSDFMNQLRSFKPQSLGCAVARRKSSTTLIFPLPPQSCSDEFCEEYPHQLIPTPGYWIECSRQNQNRGNPNVWDEQSESDFQEKEEEDSKDDEDEVDDDDEENEDFDGNEGARKKKRKNHANIQVCTEEDEDRLPRICEPTKTSIEEQWEKNGCFELTSVEQETYEKYLFGTEHWNYFTNDEDLGPVILSLKQETLNGRDQFRILVRAISYTVHGLIPASCVFADRYNREEVVRSLGKEINLSPPLTLGQLPDTPEELLKLDQVFIKSELKVGVIYVKEGQYTEEEILDNNDNSALFEEFLQILGEKVRLKGFDKYKGGLDTVHDLTGLYSVYTHWRGIEIMFHVGTLLPYEKNDPQKLQRKRHIGNDIVCVVFLEGDNTHFSPSCIKSHFLHTFIVVRCSPRSKRKPTRYEVSVITRDEVGAYKPYLWEQSTFRKLDRGAMFREWMLTKVVNGERASYSAPKFARMQERTRSQMLEDIVANLQNHAETGQIPKPYRRGSWRPIGHMRPSSPLLDSVRDQFEAGYDQLAKDFTKFFLNTDEPTPLFDVVFLVGQGKQKSKLFGVRAILGVRSRVFQEMLYGISTGFGSPQVPVAELLARAVPTLMSPQRPKSNFLQVPDIESTRPKSVPSSPMVMRAFSRLGSLTAGWGRSGRKSSQQQQLAAEDKKKWSSSQDCSQENKDKEAGKDKPQLAVPRLSVCADAQKVDRTKLAQTEFMIIEFDPETFRLLLDYLHTGSCPLTCANIPGLICAAEHYDLPDLLQACFHHAKQFLRIEVVCPMLCSLENYYWRYTSASELVNMILAFVETRAYQLFDSPDFLSLSESMVQMVMSRNLEVAEIRKFEAMLAWARHKIRSRPSTSKVDAKIEFKCTMERLARDLKLYRISPQDLIKIVLPSKAIKNERILETLMFQANSGMYRIQDSYIEACQQRIQKQDSRFSESFDYGL
ncbi:uncharacterized protein LOC110846270 isoform X3 [Folsomia candida]|uniref:uncharacterized protein LOC110846270 isoform X3 n=1 Tax=Folsomia candida TaxID=158441 RepID=UPI0016050956|nr:uncharacterized protein LOC110846270 isoform X3 [Folsomia candida]